MIEREKVLKILKDGITIVFGNDRDDSPHCKETDPSRLPEEVEIGNETETADIYRFSLKRDWFIGECR